MNILTFDYIPFAIILGIILSVYGTFSKYTDYFLLIFLVPLGIIAAIIAILTDRYYKKSEAYVNGAQNCKFSPNKPHHGIIFVQYRNQYKFFIADCIDLLVKILDENLPYKVYPVKNEDDFKQVYANPNIHWLWIFGHGEKNHLTYFENNEPKNIYYSNYSKQSNLSFIAQLHCNPGSGKSLPEINTLTPDYDINHIRFPFQNRCYVKRKAKEFIAQL